MGAYFCTQRSDEPGARPCCSSANLTVVGRSAASRISYSQMYKHKHLLAKHTNTQASTLIIPPAPKNTPPVREPRHGGTLCCVAHILFASHHERTHSHERAKTAIGRTLTQSTARMHSHLFMPLNFYKHTKLFPYTSFSISASRYVMGVCKRLLLFRGLNSSVGASYTQWPLTLSKVAE